MARELVTKSARFYCISLEPDICKTPMGPATRAVPYTIKGEFGEAIGISANIRSGGAPVVIHASTVIPTVTGDEQGTAKGVKSKTVAARVQHDEKSTTVTFNGEQAIREGDRVFMNDRNTTGKIYERGGAPAAPLAGAVDRAGAVAERTVPDNASDPFMNLIMAVRNSDGAVLGAAGGVSQLRSAALDAVKSELGFRQLPSLPAFIPLALLNRLPGGVAARTLSAAIAPPLHPAPPEVTAAGGDARLVKKELAKLPKNVLDTLKNANIKVMAVRVSIVEAVPELRDVVPRGWGATGKTWNDVPGIFMPERNLVAVATSGANTTGSGNMILHEVGHGYDHAMGDLSQSLSFSAAYEADKNHLPGYYRQGGIAGRQEAFAESFANYYGKHVSYFTDKPQMMEYWRNLPAPMQTGSRAK